jgi:sulfur relay (sulfurtransferase) DsrF/TusC family protein
MKEKKQIKRKIFSRNAINTKNNFKSLKKRKLQEDRNNIEIKEINESNIPKYLKLKILLSIVKNS